MKLYKTMLIAIIGVILIMTGCGNNSNKLNDQTDTEDEATVENENMLYDEVDPQYDYPVTELGKYLYDDILLAKFYDNSKNENEAEFIDCFYTSGEDVEGWDTLKLNGDYLRSTKRDDKKDFDGLVIYNINGSDITDSFIKNEGDDFVMISSLEDKQVVWVKNEDIQEDGTTEKYTAFDESGAVKCSFTNKELEKEGLTMPKPAFFLGSGKNNVIVCRLRDNDNFDALFGININSGKLFGTGETVINGWDVATKVGFYEGNKYSDRYALNRCEFFSNGYAEIVNDEGTKRIIIDEEGNQVTDLSNIVSVTGSEYNDGYYVNLDYKNDVIYSRDTNKYYDIKGHELFDLNTFDAEPVSATPYDYYIVKKENADGDYLHGILNKNGEWVVEFTGDQRFSDYKMMIDENTMLFEGRVFDMTKRDFINDIGTFYDKYVIEGKLYYLSDDDRKVHIYDPATNQDDLMILHD